MAAPVVARILRFPCAGVPVTAPLAAPATICGVGRTPMTVFPANVRHFAAEPKSYANNAPGARTRMQQRPREWGQSTEKKRHQFNVTTVRHYFVNADTEMDQNAAYTVAHEEILGVIQTTPVGDAIVPSQVPTFVRPTLGVNLADSQLKDTRKQLTTADAVDTLPSFDFDLKANKVKVVSTYGALRNLLLAHDSEAWWKLRAWRKDGILYLTDVQNYNVTDAEKAAAYRMERMCSLYEAPKGDDIQFDPTLPEPFRFDDLPYWRLMMAQCVQKGLNVTPEHETELAGIGRFGLTSLVQFGTHKCLVYGPVDCFEAVTSEPVSLLACEAPVSESLEQLQVSKKVVKEAWCRQTLLGIQEHVVGFHTPRFDLIGTTSLEIGKQALSRVPPDYDHKRVDRLGTPRELPFEIRAPQLGCRLLDALFSNVKSGRFYNIINQDRCMVINKDMNLRRWRKLMDGDVRWEF